MCKTCMLGTSEHSYEILKTAIEMPCSQIRRVSTVKMSVPLKLIYGVNATSIKILAAFSEKLTH